MYVNINLHVSRTFTPEDGFPASVSDIQTSFDKRVDEFDRRMILLQKNYARDLLAHVNPYTKLSYAADPCVAVVEINNENSLVGDPWAALGADLDTLPEPFRGELAGLWNAWLTKKYGTDARLQAAWLKGVTPAGPAINLTAGWTVEAQGASKAAMTFGADGGRRSGHGPALHAGRGCGDGRHGLACADASDRPGLQNGTTYTVSFRAKADKPREMPVAAGLDQADWHNIGLAVTAELGTDWQTYRYTFDAHDVASQHGRVAFTLGGQTGTVWISGLQVKPGAEGAGLQQGQSLASRTVAIPPRRPVPSTPTGSRSSPTPSAATPTRCAATFKNTLKVHANVICSQISWGGLTGINREADMDFADNHAYWQHPSFPHKAWDPNDWTIGNTSMVADLAGGGGGTLRGLAEYRVAGKPYSVSEYNEPAPNDYQAEMVPVLATFAAFQDWDMIYLFDYGDYGAGVANDKINGYFAISSNPAKTAFLPAAAMIFRAGQSPVSPIVAERLLTPAQTLGDSSATAVWKEEAISSQDALFTKRLQVVPPGNRSVRPSFHGPAPSLLLAKNGAGAYYSAGGRAAVGVIGGQTVRLGQATLTFPRSVTTSPR